jgi:hypothetical protein
VRKFMIAELHSLTRAGRAYTGPLTNRNRCQYIAREFLDQDGSRVCASPMLKTTAAAGWFCR